MVGLILQDILGMKKVLKSGVLILVFYLVLGIASERASDYGAFFVFFSVFLVAPIFAYREKCHWDMYANTMPVNRKEMVGATYVTAMVMVGIGVVLNLLLIGIDVIKNTGDLSWIQETFFVLEVVAAVGIFYIGLIIPILFKFGSEKGRIVMFAAYIIPFAIIMLMSKLDIDWNQLFMNVDTEQVITGAKIGLPVAAVVWIIVTYAISLKIYQNKDLV